MPSIVHFIAPLGVSVALLAAPLWHMQRRSDVITAEEIERVRPSVGTAYDAVRTLRPRWMRSREVALQGRPDDLVQSVQLRVYVNDVDMGGLDHLKTIPAETVQELRWLSTTQAGVRFGPTNGPGIVVTLKR